MKPFQLGTLLCLAFLLVAAPTAEANKFNPKSGTKLKLKMGQKTTISVTGFQGCKFEALHYDPKSTDPEVVSVTTPGKEGKSQKVTIEAVGPGMTEVSIITQGESPSCNGFMATYAVEVEADPKAFLKQAKGKLKDGIKSIKSELDTELGNICTLFDLAAGFATQQDASEAVPQVWDAMEELAADLDGLVQQQLDDIYGDIWQRAEQYGFAQNTPELVGLLDGGCGDWDKFVNAAISLYDKAWDKLLKKYKKLIKTIDGKFKNTGENYLSLVEMPQVNTALTAPVPIPVPAPLPQPDPQPKPLKKHWSAAGRLSSSSTADLTIGGSADPGGGDVTVSMTGPGGAVTPVDASVGDDCNWQADFSGLTPGTYRVTLTQGGNTATFTKYVP